METSLALACTSPSSLRLQQGPERARLPRCFCAPVLDCFRHRRGVLSRCHTGRGSRCTRDIRRSFSRSSVRHSVGASSLASARSGTHGRTLRSVFSQRRLGFTGRTYAVSPRPRSWRNHPCGGKNMLSRWHSRTTSPRGLSPTASAARTTRRRHRRIHALSGVSPLQ